VRVPTQALLEGNRVLVYDPKNTVLVERQLQTGVSNWAFTEITSGVQPGEQVVLSVEREGVAAGVHAIPESRPRR
jgi:HlyD family secretion protein